MKKLKLHTQLKAARIAQNLTVRDIERLSRYQISNGYVSHIENGRGEPPHPNKLRVLAKILHLDYMQLLGMAGYL